MSIDSLSEIQKAYLQRRVRAAQDLAVNCLDAVKALYAQGMTLVWEQEAGVGPVEVFELLAEDGVSLFGDGAALLGFILSRDPDWVHPVPTRDFELHEDGTVTLGDEVLESGEAGP